MKILLINSVCGIRSTGRMCTEIADEYIKNGHEVRIAYGREDVPIKYKNISIRIGNDYDTYFSALKVRVFDNEGFNNYRATKEFLRWVDEYNPDVIHLHNLHGYYVNLELFFNYLKKVQKPVVWTLHDCWAFTGHCAHFDYIGCQKWKIEGCHHCKNKKSYPSSFLFDRSERNFIEKKRLFTGLHNIIIVTPSQWLADLVKHSFLKDYTIKVIHNGIDMSKFKSNSSGEFRKKYGLQDKTIFLGVASAWGELKGLYDFYKMNKMKKENEVFVLVGLTQQQLSSLPDGIIGISKTNSIAELAEIYSTANVFINPTYQDNYPTVNLEAQSCGTPVVTYRTGGSIESVPAVCVVDKGRADLLLYKARCVLKTRNIMDISDFSHDRCYDKYFDIYREIVRRL